MSKPGGDQEKDGPSEDNIRVVCRFRPLNDSEEKAGSKFVVKFPSDDGCVSIGVRSKGYVIQKYHQCKIEHDFFFELVLLEIEKKYLDQEVE